MGAFIARQPNGLLCRFSSVVDCVTDYNMTEEEYIEMCAEKARKEARDVLDDELEEYIVAVQEDAFYWGYMTAMKRCEKAGVVR